MAAQAAIYGGIAALELAGGYFASQNIKQAAELNRDIAEMNAEFAELDAYDSELEGISRSARYQSVIDNTLAEQSAIMNAQDIDVSYGSASSVQAETKFLGELNMMEIQKQARQQALGYTRQARDYRIGGSLNYASDQARASSAMFSAITSAAKTGLTGYARSGGGSSGGGSKASSSSGGTPVTSGTVESGAWSTNRYSSDFEF
jgi:hypothetical protein